MRKENEKKTCALPLRKYFGNKFDAFGSELVLRDIE
jgi:hypothetical protein